MSRAAAPARVVAFLPGLRTILQRLRATTSTPSSLTPTLLTSTPSAAVASASQAPLTDALYDSDLVSAHLHPMLPLPGSTAPAPHTLTPTPPFTLDSLPNTDKAALSTDVTSSSDLGHGMVECVALACPSSLHTEFMQLFPGVAVSRGELLVVTLSQQTKNDMTGWSPAVETEREQLMEHFVASAKEICSRLTAAGYWADFIDPASGRAFYSPYSPETLFETDDRFRYLGFDIMDLGCCRCISHHLWGVHTFVGTIFSNAPSNSASLQSVMLL